MSFKTWIQSKTHLYFSKALKTTKLLLFPRVKISQSSQISPLHTCTTFEQLILKV